MIQQCSLLIQSHPQKKVLNELSLATVFDDVRKNDTGARDARITELEEEVKSWKDKFHHVKKRNQQLLVMLQQGESERLSIYNQKTFDPFSIVLTCDCCIDVSLSAFPFSDPT